MKLVRKIDCVVLTFCFVIYFLCSLDRGNLANVHDDILEDVGLVEWQYSIAVSAFALGGVVFSLPASVAVSRFHPTKWLAFLVLCFGALSIFQIFISNFWQLIVLRVLLGMACAGVFPGIICVLTTHWYLPNEYATRIAFISAAGSVASAMGGFIAFYALRLSAWDLSGWQWVFLLDGIPSLFVAVMVFFLFPKSPKGAYWLNETERVEGEERLQEVVKAPPQKLVEVVGVEEEEEEKEKRVLSAQEALYLALGSSLTWAFAFGYLGLAIPIYSISYYLPALFAEMGYGTLMANLLTVPVYLLSTAAALIAGAISDRTGKYGEVVLIGLGGGVLGFVLVVLFTLLPNDEPMYPLLSLSFATILIGISVSPMLSWISRITPSQTEKSIRIGLVVAVGTLGGIIGPNLYGFTAIRDTDSSGVQSISYLWGHVSMLIDLILALALNAGIHIISPIPAQKRLTLHPDQFYLLNCDPEEMEDTDNVVLSEDLEALLQNFIMINEHPIC